MPQTKKNLSIYVPKQSLLFHLDPKNLENLGNSSKIFNLKNHWKALIEASAGTGKTFALVELVLELMLENETPLKNILLVTFTEKATTELKLRLRLKLRELLEAFEKQDAALKLIPKIPFWEINSTKAKILKAGLLDFDSAQVYTIHGFCKRILSEFAFENRQLFQQQFCDTNLIFQEVFIQYVRTKLLSKKTSISMLFELYVRLYEGNLDTLQNEILSLFTKHGELIPKLPNFDVFLNKFSKFWDIFICRDLILREKKMTQHPILNAFKLTALYKNSREKTLKNVDLLLQVLDEFHSGANILEILPKFFQILLSSITKPKCKKVLQLGEKWLSPEEFPEDERIWINALFECEKFLRDCKITFASKKILKAWLIQNVLLDLRNELSKIKLEKGIFDFDDLLSIVEKELLLGEENVAVLTPLKKAVRKKFSCAIVDEFQDTDTRQWFIFKNLFMESSKHRLILIGDPKQSIYSFRGADIFSYLQARKNIKERTSQKPFFLKKNFRSTEKMISGLNQIFSGDAWFPVKRGIFYQHVECGNKKLKLKDKTLNRNSIHILELSPQFTISSKKIENQKKLKSPKFSLDILKKLDQFKGEKFFDKKVFLKKLKSILGDEIVLENKSALINLFLDDQSNNAAVRFAEAIALEIRDILRFNSSGIKRPIWCDENKEQIIMERDICVLFRKSIEGEILVKALRRYGIDFEFYKQKGLFGGREALEILNLLEAIAHNSDHSCIGKLWLTRFFEVKVNQLHLFNINHSNILYKLKEWNYYAGERKFRKLFDEILKQTKLVERELFLRKDERSVTNYLHLFEILNRQASERQLDLLEMIQLLKRFIDGKENLGENENLLRMESERNSVQLMTMHASKGLEFPIVFLFGGLTASKKGSYTSYHDAEENQIIDLLNSTIPEEHQWQSESEQQRLLYVSMTRARGRLYLPYVKLLSDESEKRVCKINGAYLTLNERLSEIVSKKINFKKNTPFSSSVVGIPSQNKNEVFLDMECEKLTEKISKSLRENPFYLKNKKNEKQTFDQVRLKKRGFVVTSFSRISRKENDRWEDDKLLSIQEFPSFETVSESEFSKSRENDEILPETKQIFLKFNSEEEIKKIENEDQSKHKFKKPELQGGFNTGNLLHALLEHTDFSIIEKSNSMEEWLSIPTVMDQIESFNESYGYSHSVVPKIAKIIWNTLRTQIKLGVTPNSPKLELATIKKDLREVNFYFPLFKKVKKIGNLYGNIQNQVEGWNLGKGVLRGSIDFLFEHKGLIYFVDWKSNILSKYDQKSLELEVLRHYELQLQIYTLATCYWFKLNSEEKYNDRFGGAVYLFLRGIEQKSLISTNPESKSTEGVYFKRPSWDEMKFFEKKLFQKDF